MSGIERISGVGEERENQKYSLTNPDDNFFKRLLDVKIQGALTGVQNNVNYTGGPIFGKSNTSTYGIANG